MKRGFTLIELLTVIVILAIITLISTPIVMGLINNVRKEAFKDSAYGIRKAGELLYSKNAFAGTNEVITFTYNDGVESSSIAGKELKYKGAKPQNGLVKINSEGLIAMAIHNGIYCAKKGYYGNEIILSDEELNECNVPLYADKSGAAIPELTAGMIPVQWNGQDWIKADASDEWYDYDSQEWANAVTVTNANRDTYLSATSGTIIPMSDINTMWVWIPRYEYETITSPTATEIKVNFISKSITTETINHIIHPAFTFGTTEVSGFWIGKFETTGDIASPTILPNQPALTMKRIKDMYDNALTMKNNQTYGFGNDVNIHMAKNNEWGAAAYLSQSKYGKYGNPLYDDTVALKREVYINPSSTFITGRGGNIVSQSITTDDLDSASANLYGYDGKECSIKTGYICNGQSQAVYGMASSTTGNIYGAYGMSGGAWEYVMGMYRPNDATSVTDNSGFGAATTTGTLPTSEYWDRYTTDNVLTACDGGICYGHALSETKSWYSDGAGFMIIASPWSMRGGYHSNTIGSGPFYYNRAAGGAISFASFRLVQMKP